MSKVGAVAWVDCPGHRSRSRTLCRGGRGRCAFHVTSKHCRTRRLNITCNGSYLVGGDRTESSLIETKVCRFGFAIVWLRLCGWYAIWRQSSILGSANVQVAQSLEISYVHCGHVGRGAGNDIENSAPGPIVITGGVITGGGPLKLVSNDSCVVSERGLTEAVCLVASG